MSKQAIFVLVLWFLSIVVVILLLYRFQRIDVQKTEDDLKIKENEIEKEVSVESLDQLVSDNNKDSKS